MMTKEDISFLRGIGVEEHLRHAYYDKFKHMTTSAQNHAVADILDKYTCKKHSRNFGCGTCVLNLYREVGKLYFDALEQEENETVIAVNEEEPQPEAEPEEEAVQPELEPTPEKKEKRKTSRK